MNEALQVASVVLGFVGFGGIVSGLTIRAIGKKIDKNEARREERENAQIEETILMREGICAVGHLAEATALAQRDGKTNGTMTTALRYYQGFKDKEDEFLNRQAARHVHGGG